MKIYKIKLYIFTQKMLRVLPVAFFYDKLFSFKYSILFLEFHLLTVLQILSVLVET